MMRIAAYLRRQDLGLCDTWYAANGHAFYEEGKRVFTEDGATEVLAQIGQDPSIVGKAISDPSTTDEVRADHEYLVNHHGGHRVPTLVFADGQALFGPVITTAPYGDDALALWELVALYRRFPRLYELRRPKRANDMASRALLGAARDLRAVAWTAQTHRHPPS